MQMKQWVRAALGCATALAIASASAQTYPDRPITMVVPFTPGGVSDVTARPLAIGMSANLGQSIVIENKGGAGGAIGMTAAAKAKPDGYTLLMALPSMITIPISDRISGRAATFQMDQFRPVARLTADPTVLAVRAESPWNSLEDFVRDVRKNPGKISYSSSGIYGTTHVAMEILAHAAGLQMIHVPFSGGGQQITALLAGQVDATMQTPGAIAAHIASGKFKVLTAMSEKRVPSLPQVPTSREAGYGGEFYLWTGVFVPAATPDPIVERLRSSIKEASAHTAFTTAMAAQKTPIQYMDADEFARFLVEDTKRFETVLGKMGKIQ
ncbi:tripartite tricarboxylate transporter substrate binding protein [Ramlibacter sp. AN1015]|uniref:Bug family tripartite tricarboxylate transporter substrate binding protein n=1 Tax=Ramlibacter sp. AN1015 TaxID=3133428 RepID=UPI0030BA86D6